MTAKKPSWTVLLYCFIVSVAFVLNLYLLVPIRVRRLPRNDPIHIRWRLLSVTLSTVMAISLQPLLLGSFVRYSVSKLSFSFSSLLHVMLLYLGPIAISLWKTHSSFRLAVNTSKTKDTHALRLCYSYHGHYWTSLYWAIRRPFLNNPWCGIRDLFLAPLMEEMVFRCCIVPPFFKMILLMYHPTDNLMVYPDDAILLSSIRICCFLSPLFFGLAHVHHALVKYTLHDKTMLPYILLETVVQFTYTTLFGAYACWVLCCTSNWIDVVLIHSFCNFMGLPSLSLFFHPVGTTVDTPSVPMKFLLGCLFLLGMVVFYLGFTQKTLFFPPKYTLLEYL